jgi:hypothetical protein
MAARERMNELLADYSLPRDAVVEGPFNPELMGGIEAGWRAQLTTGERPSSAAGQLALDRVQLEVWWRQNGARRTLELEGFRKRFLLKSEGGPGPQ